MYTAAYRNAPSRGLTLGQASSPARQRSAASGQRSAPAPPWAGPEQHGSSRLVCCRNRKETCVTASRRCRQHDLKQLGSNVYAKSETNNATDVRKGLTGHLGHIPGIQPRPSSRRPGGRRRSGCGDEIQHYTLERKANKPRSAADNTV